MNPASPNLANLKKRAKTVLRQHAQRHVPVAERIRRALPAFAGRSDREVLGAEFTLALAQQVVARELGFADWTQLRRSIETMSTSKTIARPVSEVPASDPEILRVHPQVFVTDLARAVAFYRDRLGFAVAYLYGEPPFYGLVERGGAGLNLRHVDASPFHAGVREREDLLAATLVVRNLKALFVAYKEAGVAFHQPYREQPWGAHDFIVADPDGNLIHFASAPGEA
jgi:catechol 2,3-dioxygenase-like lactoylglutathione lyase family enzyme